MGKSTAITIRETDSHWDITQRRVERERSAVATRDGSHLQPMFVSALQVAGANGLASQIEALTVSPEVGYDASARHSMSIETAKGGAFIVKVLTKDAAGNQRVTGDFEASSHTSIKAAFSGLAGALDAPLFAAQIAAL